MSHVKGFMVFRSRVSQECQRGNVLDVGLEIRDGKDHLLGNEVLSVHREGKGEREQVDEKEKFCTGVSISR